MSNVIVLYGGKSAEREVSLVSGAAVAQALKSKGHEVTLLDAVDDFLMQVAAQKPDVVFNALHGKWGEDGCVQGALELLNIPYTHSGVTASAVAMDKPMTKQLVGAHGVKSPEGIVCSVAETRAIDTVMHALVVKPVDEGSSVGVCILRQEGDTVPADWADEDQVLVEEFIPGRELTVAVMGDRALAVTEIDTSRTFYDYEAKYAHGGSQHTIPADIPDLLREIVMEWAVTAHQVLGCRGVSRSDFRYDEEQGRLAFLEINTQPGMTPTSLVPEQAEHVGISFADLCDWMIQEALTP